MTKRYKVTVDDIIGIVHTDETTNSVEEVCKLRGRTNERFMVDTVGTLIDKHTRDTFDYVSEVLPLLNDYEKSVNNLKETILKITIAYQRKYDRTIVDLMVEVHEEDITDLIKELQ